MASKVKTVEEAHNLPTYNTEDAIRLMQDLLKMPPDVAPTMVMIGGVGIGKTAISEAVPRALGYEVITRHLSQIHPLDLGCVGLDSDTREMYFAKPALVQEVEQVLQRSSKPVVLFLDEIDRVQPIAQSGMLQLLLSKKLNGYHMPNTYIIGAGNAWYAQYTFEMDKAFASRPALIHIVSSHEGWLRWASQAGVHQSILLAVTMAPDILNQHQQLEAAVKVADPRAWEGLSTALRAGVSPAHAAAFVGEHAARTYQRYLTFANDYRKEIQLAAAGKVPKLPNTMTSNEQQLTMFGIYLAATGTVKEEVLLDFFTHAAEECGHERAYIIGNSLRHHIPDQRILAVPGMKQLHQQLFHAYEEV